MSAEFAFLEITYDSKCPGYDVKYNLRNLGFTKIAYNSSADVSVWKVNLNIIFLREGDIGTQPSITGLGFVCDQALINQMQAGYDSDNDFYFTHDPNGLKVYMVPSIAFNANQSVLSDRYTLLDDIVTSYNEILPKYISGVSYSDFSEDLVKFYQNLGFRITRSGNTYHNCVSQNNRFTIMLNSFGSTKRIDSVICETDDVFNTTAYYVNNDVPLKKYNTKPTNFKKLNYKIAGYNCIATGNENSYSIENSINSISELFNVIFRMRKQHLHIEEHTLKEHLDEQFN